jgi:nucleoside-diphosphate-sugar epimerase
MKDSTALGGMPVLLTGATGFIGSYLARRLAAEEGAVVTGIGRNLSRVAELRDHGVDLVVRDLLDPTDLHPIITGHDLVFHAAAMLDADPETAQAVNVNATERLVRAAGRAGACRFVHVSTVGVYDMEGRSVVDESTPLATDHPATYPRTKAQAERRAFEAANETGIELAVVRPSMVYGPGHGLWSETMARNVCEGNPVFLGDGSAHFHPVYVDDVVDGLVRCATSPHASGEAFNLSAEVTTWRDFMSYYGTLCDAEPKGLPLWMARLMAFANKIPGVRTPVDQGFIEMATSRKQFPTDKARERLGWSPTVDLDQGMQRTARWLKEQDIV